MTVAGLALTVAGVTIHIDRWKSGGCLICGAKERDGCPFAHERCWLTNSVDARIAINHAMDEIRRPVATPTIAKKPTATVTNNKTLPPILDRAARFLASLDLSSQSRATRDEARAIVTELATALDKTK